MTKKEKFFRIIDRTVWWILNIILITYVLSLLVPIIWMVFTAFKSYPDYYDNMFGPPSKWIFSNFSEAFGMLKITRLSGRSLITFNVLDMALTSFLYAFGSALMGTLMPLICAYVIARYRFKFCEFLYALGIIIMVTPIIGSSASTMVVKRAMGVYDNMLLTILTGNSTAFSGFTFMMIYASCRSLPQAYSEAAELDGAGPWIVFFKIMLPMMLPLCTVVFVLGFLESWNNYSLFVIWLPSYANLAYGVYMFQNDSTLYGANITHVMAGFSIIIIPTMIMYICFNKIITNKYTVGGLKG